MLHKKTGGQNKKNIFCRVLGLALGKEVVCRVPTTWHSAKSSRPGGPRACHVAALCRVPNGRHSAKVTAMDAVCPLALFAVPMFAESPALGKELLCRVPEFAEGQALGKASFAECWVWRSAKWLFAECPSFATRQTSTHSAKIQFPVVVA